MQVWVTMLAGCLDIFPRCWELDPGVLPTELHLLPFLFFYFKTGSPYVSQAGPELGSSCSVPEGWAGLQAHPPHLFASIFQHVPAQIYCITLFLLFPTHVCMHRLDFPNSGN